MASTISQSRPSERGSAGVKFLIFFVLLLAVANAGYNYVPVAYASESFKQEMQTSVVNALATPGRVTPTDYIKNRLQKAIKDNDLPTDTVVDVKQAGTVIQAHAAFTKPVNILPFGLYTYNYHFDYTAIPQGFLTK